VFGWFLVNWGRRRLGLPWLAAMRLTLRPSGGAPPLSDSAIAALTVPDLSHDDRVALFLRERKLPNSNAITRYLDKGQGLNLAISQYEGEMA